MEKETIKKIINGFSDKKVCVIGDTIIDISYDCESAGISLETPTLKATLNDTAIIPGGAFGVATNLSNILNQCYFVTLVGDDENKDCVFSTSNNLILKKIYDAEKRNNIKRRYWVSKGDVKYKYFQLNTECKKDISADSQQELILYIKSILSDVDCLVIADYRNGMLTKDTLAVILAECKNVDIPVIINSQLSSHSVERFYDFVGCDLLVVNEDEYKKVKEFFNCKNKRQLSSKMKCGLCITRGAKGSTIIINDTVLDQEAFPASVVDTCGAGDSFISMLACCDFVDYPQETLQAANMWASMFVSTSKETIPTIFELKDKLGL